MFTFFFQMTIEDELFSCIGSIRYRVIFLKMSFSFLPLCLGTPYAKYQLRERP
jgi:hypothetical protein